MALYCVAPLITLQVNYASKWREEIKAASYSSSALVGDLRLLGRRGAATHSIKAEYLRRRQLDKLEPRRVVEFAIPAHCAYGNERGRRGGAAR